MFEKLLTPAEEASGWAGEREEPHSDIFKGPVELGENLNPKYKFSV